ncbi:MAG: helix-turn-helix transcriptional regulator [Sphingopyxis sp.]|nr:helix-turn-helix transcriptional regulator [Sphingopyxis sp.]
MSDSGGEIHLVLPDPIERAACFRMLAAGAARVVRGFASADDYLDAEADRAGGLLLFHWHQPGATSGAALLSHVAARPEIAAFVAAERLSLADTRLILRGGAADVLPAPLDPQMVRRTLDRAFGDWQQQQAERAGRRAAEARLAALTPRERDILAAIAAGLGNKAIARQLDLSPRTVEVHRANIMRRAEAGSVAELLRLRFMAEGVNSLRFGA